ncbi:N-acetyltransferase-like protein [Cercophora newfieldiana]|uniref:N-acetyltransferase-like protein n=1 Tax=Cercophora newfieldiana TaxID=92897 RepID=A0AA39XWQ1_9PEZI|nr:N-acetyltransferase-like protein [Cercophora newfieldiana]
MENPSSNSNGITIELKRSLVPSKWEETPRVLGMSECREAALTLAHAFAADEYAQYLVDPGDSADGVGISPEDKWKLHVDIMTYAVAAHCLDGLVTAIGPDYDCVALWLPPGKDLDGWMTVLRSGMWRLYFSLSAEGRKRYFEEVLPLLHDTKREVLGERDARAWYLVFLGTKPNSQGRGYARMLVEDGIRRADAEHRPMYLESSSLANNRYYARYGFEVQRDIFLERGKTPVRWSTVSIMVREPGAGRKSTACKAAGTHPHGTGGRQLLGMGKRGLALGGFHVVGGLNAKIG